MNAATAQARTLRRELSAAEAFARIELHRISLIPVLDGRIWQASTDVPGQGRNARRAVGSLSAMAGDSLGAVCALVKKLEAEGA